MNSDIKITVLTSLFNCSKYLEGYFNCLSKLNNTQNIEVLLLHNAPSNEEMAIISKYLPSLSFVKHIIISEREGLYRTWNRGIDLANGEYICVWNVDDIRTPNSIIDQAETLDKNPNTDLTYGDFYYMFKYPEPSDILVVNKDFSINKNSFFRTHQIGCFPMWRKRIHDKLGFFDEQFKLVSDFDFQIRVARTSQIVKTNNIVGYYLENVPEKLSSNLWIQIIERNALYLRYGMFDLINWLTIFPILKKYEITHLSYYGKKESLFKKKYLYNIFIITRIPLFILSIFRQPRFIFAYIKHNILNK
ncbi:Glycosyltransferase involved in cell wall bisynthesis [Bacteroides luti]|uniref:Glycosyltransferase involved in cell wall bisynthesis n=1 Tax=Bacteroides luti TaxID=1297750 RepID=A0A1M4STG1_9BACE|nr:glycosyltransferase [Bacteroides luti]SHE35486.1 Glycosyltransferase involved in cell wall bisynthesis [Bacteroides luti]